MTTPAGWADLVTTALLGTDRRPLEADDPPVAVLRAAARHRVLDQLTGPRPEPALADQTRSEPALANDGAEAPAAADRLLAELLRTPDPAVISCWLGACAGHGRTVAAVHWTPLARLAARTTAYDRVALGAAIGARGRWFLRQNPEWRRLAVDAGGGSGGGSAGRGSEQPPDADVNPQSSSLLAEEVLAEPERLLAHPQPWDPDLVAAGFAVLAGEGHRPPHRWFATRLGVALPTALYPGIAKAAELYLLAPDISPVARRSIRDRFVALELAAYARAAIDHAFGADSTGSFTRAEIPHV